jgi:hypothetical protein
VTAGLTSYPFLNKWDGFDRWVPYLGVWLAWAALAGLLCFVRSSSGRILLLVAITSLVPYAFTWQIVSDWRFTAHVYPFLLIAACLAISWSTRWLAPSRWRSISRPTPRTCLIAAAVLIGASGTAWTAFRILPVRAVGESLRTGRSATIAAGSRDRAFFTEGWSRPFGMGTTTMRAAEGKTSVIQLPVNEVGDYVLTFRMDPFPRPRSGGAAPLPTVLASINGISLAALQLRWNPDRVGTYTARLPGSAVREGMNRLTLTTRFTSSAVVSSRVNGPPFVDAKGFTLWYVQIEDAEPPA